MKDLLADLAVWRDDQEEIALATLVGVRGSAPRLPGARLAVTRSARMSGSVSGGCVENAVFEQAMKVLDARRPSIAHFGISDEQGFEVGLSCGGTIDVLIERFTPDAAWKGLQEAVAAQRPAALAIGLAPDELMGRRFLVLEDSPGVGGIDPELDAEVTARARALLPAGDSRSITLPWRNGEARVFIESFPPPLRLYLVGATHAAIHLCRLASQVGFRVTVIDARGIFANPERFEDAEKVIHAWPQEVLTEDLLDPYAYVVTLTHDFKIDIPALACALRSQARYIGALGSRTTHARRVTRMREEGFSDSELARLHAPIGLDLGGRGPEQIALSILAEMLAVRHGRSGSSLSTGSQRIHGDS